MLLSHNAYNAYIKYECLDECQDMCHECVEMNDEYGMHVQMNVRMLVDVYRYLNYDINEMPCWVPDACYSRLSMCVCLYIEKPNTL